MSPVPKRHHENGTHRFMDEKKILAAPEEAEDAERERKDAIKRKAARLLFLLAVLIMLISVFVFNDAHSDDDKHRDKTWYTEYTPDMVELSLPEEENAPAVYETMQVAYGNSREYAACGSIAAEDEKYFYLADPSKEGFIYSVSKADRSRIKLTEIPASEIILIKGRLYFINPAAYGEYKAGLYSCLTNGASLRYIIEGSLRSLSSEGNTLYYIRNNDSRLYSYDTSREEDKCICDDRCINYQVSENAVFYISSDEGRAAGADRVICRMGLNGEDKLNLTEHGNFGDIGFIGGKLAFVVYDEGYGLIDPESDVTVSLSDLEKKLVKMKGLYSLPVESEDSLWYIDRSRERQLVRRDMQTRKEEEMDAYNVTSFYIVKDSVIYAYMEGGTEYCVASRLSDGWEPAALFEGELR